MVFTGGTGGTDMGKLGRAGVSGPVKGSVIQDFGHTVTTSLGKAGSAYVVCLADSCAPSLDLRKERCEVLEHSSKTGNRLPG